MLIALVTTFLIALVAGYLFEKIKLPALIGYMLTGLFFSPYMIDYTAIKGSFFETFFITHQTTADSSALRETALFIILFRAGLGLDKDGLKVHGLNALSISIVPCLLETAAITFFAHLLFQLPLIESAIIGFVLAAVSPAVIVPQMLELQKNGIGKKKNIPTLILAGSTVDDIIAISGFGICLSLLAPNLIGEWSILLLKVPLSIIAGIVIGHYLAKPLTLFLKKTSSSNFLSVPILLIIAFGFKELENSQLFFFSHLICILSLGISLQSADLQFSEVLAKHFAFVWNIAVVILFVLIGAMVNPKVAMSAGLYGLSILAIGLLARSIGVFISLYGSKLNLKERVFCVLSYLPKATVQATVGGITLSMFLNGNIKLYEGAQTGDLIIAIAAMSILITAPIGAISMRLFSKKLLVESDTTSGIS